MAWDHRYRKLKFGEIIQEGDECQVDKPFGWKPANCIGQPAPDPAYTSHRVYRRLKEPVADSTGAPTMVDAAAMRDVARALDAAFNGTSVALGGKRHTGFVLLTFPFNANDGQANYISNGANRKDMVAFLRETAARLEGQTPQGGNA